MHYTKMDWVFFSILWAVTIGCFIHTGLAWLFAAQVLWASFVSSFVWWNRALASKQGE